MGSRGAGSGRSGGLKITKAPTQNDFNKMPTLQREKIMELQNGALQSVAVEDPQFAITNDEVYIAFTRSVDGGTSVVAVDKAGNIDMNSGVPDFRKKTKAQQAEIDRQKAETEKILNEAYARNKHSDQWAKAYRNRKRRRG